eukprot:TRINITY_DN7025_c0_g1_i1.p1 TRINITY_DN7025_c0_g1~~TRINITY_DN7025_c0_g1_i1.p1  ORF type:complete len:260 (+),score=77.73 TRINITY_DN7025_c0_g1_i1:193-972(+)
MITLPPEARATIPELKAHPWWCDMCRQCALSPAGPAPLPCAPPPAPAAAPIVQLGGADAAPVTLHAIVTEAVDKLAAQLLDGLDDIQDAEVLRRRIRKMAAEVEGLQAYALGLEEQLDGSCTRLRALQDTPRHVPPPPTLPADSLQLAVAGSIPEDVMEVFTGWGWTREEVDRDVLGPGPSLGKALYHLLQHHRAHTGRLPSAHGERLTGPTDPSGVRPDLLRQLALHKIHTAGELHRPDPLPAASPRGAGSCRRGPSP